MTSAGPAIDPVLPCTATVASTGPILDFDIMTSITEITVVSSERFRLEGEAKDASG